MNDFDYLGTEDVYLDAACQSLRPRPVINALNEYYLKHNSCGERVKYPWGAETDKKVEAAREKVLKYLKLKKKDYFVSFTLNTTYGINLLLSQLNLEKAGIKQVITSDIEHNSPFLATLTFAKKNQIPRQIYKRAGDGSMPLDADYDHALVVVNSASNIDGRTLNNLDDLIKTVHKNHGLIIIDAAQAMAHSSHLLEKTDADAICFSAHKMYAPSLGGMVVKRRLLEYIDTSFIGGGMVDDVFEDAYLLSSDNPDHAFTKFEPGLQAWGEIIALGAAIDWLEDRSKTEKETLKNLSEKLYEFLRTKQNVNLINREPTPTMSFYVDGLDSHLLGSALATEHIMARTGYFCVHYYLDHLNHYPPLIRFSLGYHTRPSDIDKVISVMERI